MPLDPITMLGAALLFRNRSGKRQLAGLAAVDGPAEAPEVGAATFKLLDSGNASAPWAKLASESQKLTQDKWDNLSVQMGYRAMGQVHDPVSGTTLQSKVVPIKSRPRADGQPKDLANWLNANQLSPLFVYPEFGWKMSADATQATAAYDLGQNDHVAWTADYDGNWTWTHTTGGVDVGQLIGDIAKLVSAIPVFGAVSVWVGMAISTALALAEGKSPSEIGQALKDDWDAAMTTSQLGFAIITGNWSTAWDAATKQGAYLQGIIDAWAPHPAPDRFGNESIQLPAPLDVTNLPAPLTNPEAPGLASVSGHPKKTKKGSARRARRGR